MHTTQESGSNTIRLYGFYETTLSNYLMMNGFALLGWVVYLVAAACLRNPPTPIWKWCHESLKDEEWVLAALDWLPLLLLVALIYTAGEMVVVLVLFARKVPNREVQVGERGD